MALPGFRPTVLLSEDPPRLTDKTSGRTLTISRGEARLLSLYDGVKTHDQLAKAAQDAGFSVDSSHVAGLIERVSHAGFMSGPPPESLSSGPELDHPTDIVPSLRPDLTIAKSAKSPGLLEVTDPVRGQTFSLYDFEVSIARMLNGRRSAGQIIDAAAKIGIPVSLESLRKFVKQLRAYRFVLEVPAEQMVRSGGTWSPRSMWKPEVRELYQSALRKFRAGKLLEATDYIVALLQIDPDNGEARELQQRINLKLDEVQEGTEFTFDELHGGADSAPDWVEAEPPPAGVVSTGAAPEYLPASVTGAPAPQAFSSAFAPPPPARPAASAFAPPPFAPPPPPPPRPSASAFAPPPSSLDTGDEEAFALAAPPSFSGAQPEAFSGASAPLPPTEPSAPLRSFSPAAGSPSAWPVRAPSAPEVAIPPLGEDLSTPSEVRRRMFDKSGSELTEEPPAPELGEPLELAAPRADDGDGGINPEQIHLPQDEAGEAKPAGFDPPQIDLHALGNAFEAESSATPDEPLLSPSDLSSAAAASKAEAVWAPPKRTQPPRKIPESERPRKKGGRGILAALLLVVAAVGGAAAFPVAVTERAMCALLELEGAKAIAPFDLELKEVLVKNGDVVEQGKPVAILNTSEFEQRVEAAEAKQEALLAQIVALDKKVKPKIKAKAELALAKAQKPITRLDVSDKKLLEQRAKFELPENKTRARKAIAAITRKLKDNEKARLKAQKKLDVAKRALSKVTLEEKRKPLIDQLEAVKAEKLAAKTELDDASVLAPASGIWRGEELAPGTALKSGDVLGSVVSTEKLKLVSQAKGTNGTLVAGLVRRPVAMDEGTALIDNADGALKAGECSLELSGGKQPLYKHLLSKL